MGVVVVTGKGGNIFTDPEKDQSRKCTSIHSVEVCLLSTSSPVSYTHLTLPTRRTV